MSEGLRTGWKEAGMLKAEQQETRHSVKREIHTGVHRMKSTHRQEWNDLKDSGGGHLFKVGMNARRVAPRQGTVKSAVIGGTGFATGKYASKKTRRKKEVK